MAKDKTTFGFNKADASELITLLGGGDQSYREGKARFPLQKRVPSGALLGVTPLGGVPAALSSAPFAFGSATCNLVDPATGALTGSTKTFYNIVNKQIAGSVLVKAEQTGPIYIIDVASCPVTAPTGPVFPVPPPPLTPTSYDLTVGIGSGWYGYESGNYGGISPGTTPGGATISDFRVESGTGNFILGVSGQDAGVSAFQIKLSIFAAFNAAWDGSAYTANVPGLDAYLAGLPSDTLNMVGV